MNGPIAEIAVNVPLRKLFHYRVPSSLGGRLQVGHRVLIPFGMRATTGICVGFTDETDVPKLKPIREILHPDCRFDEHLLKLTRWIADYYHAAWGEVLEAALPPSIRSGQEEAVVTWVRTERSSAELEAEGERLGTRARSRSRLLAFLAASPGPHPRAELLRTAETSREALRWAVEKGWIELRESAARAPTDTEDLEALSGGVAEELHPDQSRAIDTIVSAVDEGRFRCVLLHGVTGSGKTEVYLRALREVLARGKRGIILVPEISLTPQIVLRFQNGLEETRVAVLHSMQGASERARQWREIQEGQAGVVIGPRSAVFSPVQDLGLIVVDEEHDSSYKQDSSPRYHGRDVAVVRAKMLGIPVVLGSATPSLESIHNARTGKYTLVEMPRRVTSHDLPVVMPVTLKPEYYRLDGSGLVSDVLDAQIRDRLRRREQVLLFLNRRGFATFIHCIRCGFVLKCRDCDISLTFHRRQNAARCHYCGLTREVPPTCPECEMPGLRRAGVGTEKITAELSRRYEEARVARLDRDTATTHRAMRDVIARFARREFDILVGTQMVAKGHDFPNVTLVGIINADTGLQFPDFRAAERTFQLITQVAGRAGRGAHAGRVIVQTFFPDHFAVRCAVRGEFDAFCRQELEFRKTLGYPPFGRLARILFQGPNEQAVIEAARVSGEILRELAGFRVLGPVPAPITKIQAKFRHQILLKAASSGIIRAALDHFEERSPRRHKDVERIVDVDPQSVL